MYSLALGIERSSALTQAGGQHLSTPGKLGYASGTPVGICMSQTQCLCAHPAQRLTIHSSRSRFAARLSSGVRPRNMELSKLELHDADLLAVHLDPVARVAEVHLAYYPTEQARERVRGTLRFTGVSHFNQIADLVQLESHAGAGNVSYWVTGETPSVSYIYLARGLIAVTAASVELVAGA